MGKGTTSWFTIILLEALCVVGLYFDFSHSTSGEDERPSLSLHFSWASIPACSSISPAFELGGVPADTTRLNFMMTDINMPAFHHGGSSVAYTGNVVSRGAVNYTGPCPPHGEHHNYRWTVEALDASGKVLGKGTAVEMFPP